MTEAPVDAFPRLMIQHGFAAPKTRPTRHQQIEKQAQRWVAQTFYGTLLKQMRQSPFRSALFDGGRGGEAFNELFDQKLTEKMAGATHNQVVRAITRKLEKIPVAPTLPKPMRTARAQGNLDIVHSSTARRQP
jgi:Rod binding domain-containing protein